MKFSCPSCDGHLSADPEQAGAVVPCPHCGFILTIPKENSPAGDFAPNWIDAPITDPAALTLARHYSAFISYRHADNRRDGRRWADWLHQTLETYEIPADLIGTKNQRGDPVPDSLYPVFRDEEELPADADLTANIRKALGNSGMLIVICSPRACESRFVNEEIRIFKELGKSDRILALMIDGEPNAGNDPAKGERFGLEHECLPEALRRGVPRGDGTIDWDRRTEPIAADVRPQGWPMEGFTTVDAYRKDLVQKAAERGKAYKPKTLKDATDKYAERLDLAVHKILAGMLGLPLGMLTQRDKQWQLERARKQALTARRWLAAVGALAVAAMGGGVAAWMQQREAARQRDAAQFQQEEATRQRDATQFQREEAARQRDAAQYNEGLGWMLRAEVAEERQRRYPDTLFYAARAIGFDGTGREENLLGIDLGGQGDFPRLVRKDRDPDAYQKALDWIGARPSYLPVWSSELREGAAATGLDLSPTGRWLALSAEDGSVRLWDLESGEKVIEVSASGSGPARDVAFDPGGGLLAVAEKDKVRLWDLERGAFSDEFGGTAQALAWSPDGGILAGAGDKGTLFLRQNKTVKNLITGQAVPAAGLAFSPDNSAVAAIYPKAGIRLLFHQVEQPHRAWDEHREPMTAFAFSPHRAWDEHREPMTAVAFSPDGARLAAGSEDGSVSLWDVAGARPLGVVVPQQRHEGAVADLAFSPDGRRLASASADGTIKLWDAADNIPEIVATLSGHAGAVRRVVFAPGGQILASAGTDGSAKLWDVSGKQWGACKGDSGSRAGAAPEPNLFPYVAQRWYRFDDQSQELRWDSGTGFLNLPAASVIGARQAGSGDLFSLLLETGNWTGAILEAERPAERDLLAAKLLADAEAAADLFRWHRVRLRLAQLEKLGAGSKAGALAERMGKKVAEKGKPFANGEGMDLLWCPPGEFMMGESDRPGMFLKHRVILTQGFWLAKTEVTQAQYEAVVGENPSTNVSSGPTAPAENFSWHEAMEFCRKLTDRERARGAVPASWEYALPTEAQWEYACRAGTTTRWSFGDEESQLHKFGNFNDKRGTFGPDADKSQDDGQQHTAPVGSYRPNAWGFHDTHGNVSEWCRDAMDPYTAGYPAGPETDPLVTRGPYRVNRGGSFYSSAAECRSAYRGASRPTNRLNSLGLRPALVPSGLPVQYSP